MLETMKVLFLVKYGWPRVGGVERHVEEVRRRLERKGHEVKVVTEKLFTSEESLRIGGSPPRCLGAERLKKFSIWLGLWQKRGLIEKADLVHAHDVGFWYFPFRFLYPRKPFYITFHGWKGQFPVRLKNKIIRKISEKLARGNICVGQYINKWYGTRADFVTYGGVGESGGRGKQGKKKIIFIGRLEADTGLPIFLEAMKILPGWEIEFCGDGELREEAAKVGKVKGFVKNPMSHIIRSRFVFAGGYLTILEAMLAKRLVFSVYDNPLKKDYLKMTPFSQWMVVERNAKRLAEKVKYFKRWPKKEKEMVEKAYQWAAKQTWGKVAELYEKLWQK